MRLHAVLDILRRLAPEPLAEPWDRVGLQVGDPDWAVSRAMLCIDLTQSVLQEAVEAGVSLVVAYHPPIFAPLPAVTALDAKQRLILQAAQHRVAVYSPHTALDAAQGGVNDWLCEGVGQGQAQPIRVAPPQAPQQYKLVTFVPHQQADALRIALAQAGAGVIGDYTHCSFGVAGGGTFLGGDTTNPTVGQRGRLECVDELRIEMVCPADRLDAVVAGLRQAHPYEEPAFDLYPLAPPPPLPQDQVGQGRVVALDRSVTPTTLINRIKAHLGVKLLEVAVPAGLKTITRAGLCAGAGGSLLKEAGAIQAFVTGEMRHHDVLTAMAGGVMVLLAGHTQTERPYLKTYRSRILDLGGDGVEWIVSKADRPPSRLR